MAIPSLVSHVNTSSRDLPAPAQPVKKHDIELTDHTNYLPFKQIVIVFLALSLCSLVTTLDSVIVSTSLSTVSAVFNAGSVSSWVPSAYLMTSTAFQPLYGRFSDIFGRKTTLCIAMSLYIIGNLIAGFSKSIIQLIVFRGVAGAGGGGISSMLQIIVSDIISLRDRGRYIGITAAISASGYVYGPIMGGALAEKVSWRWCFWITLPLSVVATIVSLILLPSKPVLGSIKQKLLVVDYLGVVLTLVGCTLIMLPLIWGGVTFPWNSAVVLAPLCTGFFVVGIFCLWEAKGARLPIVPMYIFKHVTIVGMVRLVFFSALYYLPQFFQVALGYSPIRAGIFLIPVVISQTVSTLIAGMWVSITGRYRAAVYCGFALSAIACGCISIFTATESKAVMVVLMLLAGFGSGATMQTTTVAAQASVARKDMSVVTAVRNFLRNLGGAMSLPVASSLLNNSLRVSMRSLDLPSSTISAVVDDPSLLSQPAEIGVSSSTASFILTHGYIKGFKDIFILNAALAAFATVTSAVLIRHKELLRGDEERLRKEGREKLGVIPSSDAKVEPSAPSAQVGDIELGNVALPVTSGSETDNRENDLSERTESLSVTNKTGVVLA